MARCDQCHRTLPKGRRRFCTNKCKDRYHNINNPRGIFAHLVGQPMRDEIDEGPEGWDGHKDTF